MHSFCFKSSGFIQHWSVREISKEVAFAPRQKCVVKPSSVATTENKAFLHLLRRRTADTDITDFKHPTVTGIQKVISPAYKCKHVPSKKSSNRTCDQWIILQRTINIDFSKKKSNVYALEERQTQARWPHFPWTTWNFWGFWLARLTWADSLPCWPPVVFSEARRHHYVTEL